MLLLRSLFFDFMMYFSMLVIGVLLSPMAIWSVGGTYWVMKFYSRTVFWLLRVICNLKVEFRGTPPDGEQIVCAKHMSFLDILMLMHALPRAKYIMKKELVWAPIIGLYALRIGAAPVARGKKGAAVAKMVKDMNEAKKKDPGQLVIYPQGTRVLPGQHKPYKVGAGVLYSRFGLDCVPAASNTGVFWARRSRYRKPGVAIMEFLEPIPAGLEIPDFMEKIETVLETESDRLMVEAGFVFPEPSGGE